MAIVPVTTTQFRTSDNKLFVSIGDAEKHEKTLDLIPIKKEIKDLLNKIIMLGKDKSDDYIASVTAYCQRVIDDEADASYNEEQYYNSNCY